MINETLEQAKQKTKKKKKKEKLQKQQIQKKEDGILQKQKRITQKLMNLQNLSPNKSSNMNKRSTVQLGSMNNHKSIKNVCKGLK